MSLLYENKLFMKTQLLSYYNNFLENFINISWFPVQAIQEANIVFTELKKYDFSNIEKSGSCKIRKLFKTISELSW